MKAAMTDLTAMIRKWTPKQRKAILAVLLREQLEKEGTEMVPIVDKNKKTIGYVMPPLRIIESKLDLSTEYGREMQRRVDTWEDSIPIEELNAQLDREEKRTRQRARPQTR